MSNSSDTPPLRMQVVRALRLARQAQCVPSTRLSVQLGRHRTWVSQVERGIHNLTFSALDLLVAKLVFTVPALEPYQVVVARRVKQERLKRNLSQEALSQAAGLSVNFVQVLESGRANSSIDQIEAVAKVLEVDGNVFYAV